MSLLRHQLPRCQLLVSALRPAGLLPRLYSTSFSSNRATARDPNPAPAAAAPRSPPPPQFENTLVNKETLDEINVRPTNAIHELQSKDYANPIDNPANHDYFFDEHGNRRVTIHADSDLPDPLAEARTTRRSFYGFVALMLLTFGGIVKYEDANSPVVTSTLYTLRRSTNARALLGDNVSFYSLFPWVSGYISTTHGVVDFSYTIRGSKVPKATVAFKAEKSKDTGRFVVTEWSVTPENGETMSLLEEDYMPFIPLKNEEATSRHRSENY